MPENLPPLGVPAHCNSLLEGLQIATKAAGLGQHILEDATGAKLSYLQFWLRLRLVGTTLKPMLGEAPCTGVLLPTSAAAAISFFALHHISKIPVMLNFSAGARANESAIKTSQIDTIITSKTFILKANLQDLVEHLEKHCRIIYLEDLKPKIGKWQKLKALGSLMLGPPDSWIPQPNPNDPALILFTSGSEGVPKGVALSHKNILSNIAQARAVFEFSSKDKMFNCLPAFHSFGLNIGTLLPLLLGFPVYLFPSPLQYKEIPKKIKSSGSTIFVSADSFLRGYARTAEKDDFASLRLLVAGAEKLKPATAELYKQKFGITILQGYGVTETSPVASANTFEDNVPESVGKLMPHMKAKLEPVDGIEDGGELWLSGPNVMLGYMKEDQPGHIQPCGEWYNTGDVVRIDANGRIYITGRLKRFAKIGGEMVSLTVVEDIAHHASENEEAEHAAVAIADEKKGEKIILLTTDKNLTIDALHQAGKKLELAELYIPKKIQLLESLPKLGNGKMDYLGAKKLAEESQS